MAIGIDEIAQATLARITDPAICTPDMLPQYPLCPAPDPHFPLDEQSLGANETQRLTAVVPMPNTRAGFDGLGGAGEIRHRVEIDVRYTGAPSDAVWPSPFRLAASDAARLHVCLAADFGWLHDHFGWADHEGVTLSGADIVSGARPRRLGDRAWLSRLVLEVTYKLL